MSYDIEYSGKKRKKKNDLNIHVLWFCPPFFPTVALPVICDLKKNHIKKPTLNQVPTQFTIVSG
jgi:hypothetical protein